MLTINISATNFKLRCVHVERAYKITTHAARMTTKPHHAQHHNIRYGRLQLHENSKHGSLIYSASSVTHRLNMARAATTVTTSNPAGRHTFSDFLISIL